MKKTSLMKSKKFFIYAKKKFNTDEFDTNENDENEFDTDKNNENEFNSDENDKSKFNNDENDKNEFSADGNVKDEFTAYHKVTDHSHYTGKFRGAAHNICNLRYKTPKKILVIFHNGSTYD